MLSLVVALYWPGSAEVSNAFFEDLDDVIERSMSFACPIIITGDVNIHLDVADDPHTVRFNALLESYGLIQNVSTPTCGSHLLDITQSDYPASIKVDAPNLSDHSLITASIDLLFNHGKPATVVRRHQ